MAANPLTEKNDASVRWYEKLLMWEQGKLEAAPSPDFEEGGNPLALLEAMALAEDADEDDAPHWIMRARRPSSRRARNPRAPRINASGTRTAGLYDQDRRRIKPTTGRIQSHHRRNEAPLEKSPSYSMATTPSRSGSLHLVNRRRSPLRALASRATSSSGI